MLQSLLFLTLIQSKPFDAAIEAPAFTRLVQKRFWDAAKGQYRESVTEHGALGGDPCFAWDLSVLLSGLAAACAVDPKGCRPLYDQAAQSLAAYGSTYKGVFGYGVLPSQTIPDRYYDDNEWIALSQLDAYDASRRSSDLAAANKTFAFVMSGESNELGGGIYWREQEKKEKNTCSNAPAMAAAARLYLATRKPEYLALAERLHDWLGRLKDSDDLMFDGLSIDGKVGRTKWTYNTALMICGDLDLYQATRRKSYLYEAAAMGNASVKQWVDPTSGAIKDEASFAYDLCEAFYLLSHFDHSRDWGAIAARATEFAYLQKGPQGLVGQRWDRYEVQKGQLLLLYQGSMERALWLAVKEAR